MRVIDSNLVTTTQNKSKQRENGFRVKLRICHEERRNTRAQNKRVVWRPTTLTFKQWHDKEQRNKGGLYIHTGKLNYEVITDRCGQLRELQSGRTSGGQVGNDNWGTQERYRRNTRKQTTGDLQQHTEEQ